MSNGPLAGRTIGLLTASASRLGGGVFEAVVQQADLIASAGGRAHVIALQDEHSSADRQRFAGHRVTHLPVTGPRQIGFSPKLVRSLESADLDLLHLHGIWMYPSAAGAAWRSTSGRPYIVSPHGMLDPWITSRGRLKKAIARAGYERRNWAAASAFHALTTREAVDIARETGRDDSIVIPNAGPAAAAPRRKIPPPHFLYLGRIHPKKNIAALIAAWRQNHDMLAAAGTRLTIAGWGDAHDVAALKRDLVGAPETIHFVGPVFGEAKHALLAGARALVLPSHSEGLPMVVLEAWAKGTPALMTEECNLPDGFATGAALNCGYDPQTVGASLRQVMTMDEASWLRGSDAARDLARGPFAPETVQAQWVETYRLLMTGREGS